MDLRLRRFIIITLVCFSWTSCFSDDGFFIRKIKSEAKKVIVGNNKKITPRADTIFLASTEDGDTCELAVTKVAGNLALADASQCVFADQLQVGQHLEVKSKSPVKKKDVSKKGSMLATQWGVSVGYSLAQEMITGTDFSGVSVESTYKTNGALGFGVRYNVLPKEGPGYMGGLNYEFTRKVSSYHTSFGGVGSDTTLSPAASLSLIWLEINGAWGFGDFYGFGGLNYSLLGYSGDPSVVSSSGGAGIQAGVAYAPPIDNFSIEALYRTTNGSMTYSAFGSQYTSDYARLWGIYVRLNYFFELF